MAVIDANGNIVEGTENKQENLTWAMTKEVLKEVGNTAFRANRFLNVFSITQVPESVQRDFTKLPAEMQGMISKGYLKPDTETLLAEREQQPPFIPDMQVRQEFQTANQDQEGVLGFIKESLGNTLLQGDNLLKGAIQAGAIKTAKTGNPLAVAGATAITVANLASMADREFESVHENLKGLQDDQGNKVLPELVLKNSIEYAVSSAVIENIQTLFYLKPLSKEKALKKALERLDKPLWNRILHRAAEAGIDISTEGFEEVVQYALSVHFTNKAIEETNKRTGSTIPLQEFSWAQAGQQFKAAAQVGLVTETTGLAVGAAARHQAKKENIKTLGVDPEKLSRISREYNTSEITQQKQYLETLSEDDLLTRVRKLSGDGLNFNLEEELKGVPSIKTKLIELVVEHDPVVAEMQLNAVQDRIANSPLTHWEKFTLMMSEQHGLDLDSLTAIRQILQGEHAQLAASGKTSADFNNWLEETLRLQAEGSDAVLMQTEKSAGIPAQLVQALPPSFRRRVLDIAYENDTATDAAVKEANATNYANAFNFFYQEASREGATFEELSLAIDKAEFLNHNQKKEFKGLMKELIAYNQNGIYVQPEEFSAQQRAQAQVTNESKMPAYRRMESGFAQEKEIPDVFDSKDGIGQVPDNQEIDYKGFRVKLNPAEFLKLVPPGVSNKDSADRIKAALQQGKKIGQPFLVVDWDDTLKMWKVIDHEGRSRTRAFSSLYGSSTPMEVHILPRGFRAASITEEMRNAPILGQDKELYLKEPSLTKFSEQFIVRNMPSVLKQTGTKYSSGNQVVKAFTQFYSDKSAYIQLFKTGDFSSLAHEFGHKFLLNLSEKDVKQLANRVEAYTLIPKEKVLNLINLFQKNPRHPLLLRDGEYTENITRIHEFFARSFEQYLFNGVAPTKELIPAFQQASKEMVSIYKSIGNIPNIVRNLDPVLKNIFDHHIAGIETVQPGEQMIVRFEGKQYVAYVSKPRLESHKKLLKKFEQGLFDVAGSKAELEQYAKDILGETVPVKTKKGIVSKPNPDLKNAKLLLLLEKARTSEDGKRIMEYIDSMLVKKQQAQKNAIVAEIKDMLKDVEWKKLDQKYKNKFLELIQDIDFKQMSDKKFRELIGLKAAITSAVNEDRSIEDFLAIPMKKLEELNRLSLKNIYDFSVEEMRTLRDSIKTLIQVHALKEELLMEGIFSHLNAWEKSCSQALDLKDKSGGFIFEDNPKLTTGRIGDSIRERRFVKEFKKLLKTEYLDPEIFFSILSDYDETSPIFQMFKEMQLGGIEARRWNQRHREFAKEIASKINITKWSQFTGMIGSQGRFIDFDTTTIKVKSRDIETGKEYDALLVVPVMENELKNLPPVNEGTYQVRVGKSFVNISKETYSKLIDTQRLPTDFIYLNVFDGNQRVLLPMTKGQRISLYLWSLNENGLKHLTMGGIKLRGTNDAFTYKLDNVSLRDLRASITEEEKIVAQKFLDYFGGPIKEAGNTVSKSLLLYEILNEDFYFPLRPVGSTRGTSKELNKPALSGANRAFTKKLAERAGFLKERTGSEVPLWLDDCFEVSATYLDQVSKYLGYSKPLRIANAVIHGNRDSMNGFYNKVSRKFGRDYAEYMEEWLNRVEDDSYFHAPENNIFKYVDNAMTRAVLGANFAVALIQRTTGCLCMNYGVSRKNWLKALAQSKVMGNHTIEEVMSWHPDLHERYMQGFNVELYDNKPSSMTKSLWGMEMSAMSAIRNVSDVKDAAKATNLILRDKTVHWLYANDAWSISTIYDAVLLQEKEDNPHRTEEENKKAAIEKTVLITRRTQSDYLTENLNLMASSKHFFTRKVVYKFQSQVTKMYNERVYHTGKLLKSLRESQSISEKISSVSKWTSTMWRVHLTVPAMVTLIRQVLYEIGEDEKKKKKAGSFWERSVVGYLQNLAQTYPLIGNFLSMAIDVSTKGKYASTEVSSLLQSSLNNIATDLGMAGKNFLEFADKGKDKDLFEGFEYVGKLTADIAILITGYPLMQIKKDFKYAGNALEKLADMFE